MRKMGWIVGKSREDGGNGGLRRRRGGRLRLLLVRL